MLTGTATSHSAERCRGTGAVTGAASGARSEQLAAELGMEVGPPEPSSHGAWFQSVAATLAGG
ncbi:hypothetical protein [Streptomyces sp. NPDC058434]|uniref:hypothetical protein n=1 Tax=Streptomyces sp. NPDC058434 TaxID=3346498 RepID=UPI00366318ED